jgi:hypothetical protein
MRTDVSNRKKYEVRCMKYESPSLDLIHSRRIMTGLFLS